MAGKSKFYESIKTSLIEKDVEQVYNRGINLYFADTPILHDFDCDAFIDTKTRDCGKMLKLIIEYKFDRDMKSRVERAKVVIQVLYYLKRFENAGKILPNVCMVGDINECFVFHTNEIIKWLDEDIDWTIAPSKAAELNMPTVAKMASDETFNPFIFDVDENFSFKVVVDRINDLANNVQRYVHVTEHNIAVIFEYFQKNVFLQGKNSKVNANDLVAIFMGIITDKANYYLHPEKKGVLQTPRGEIKVNDSGFRSFISYFNRNYTPREKNHLTEISDRLIEDTNRRNKGEFYTPTLFVDYAHNMIEKELGSDWKERYVVVDPCCGSLNLTRDYRFKELYASTLEEAELEIGKRYNPEATKFQFDFLNDSIEEKAPAGLIKAFEEDRPIVFFLNPPYATAASDMGVTGESKKGVANTKVNAIMKNDNIGAASQNLYAQFLYHIVKIKQRYNLTNIKVMLFSPVLFLTGPSWKKFRKVWLNEFDFKGGSVFKASHFADVADNWGISFSVWSEGICKNPNCFDYSLIDNVNGNIEVVGAKVMYNTDNRIAASEWAKQPVKKLAPIETPNVSSAIKIRPDNSDTRGKEFDGSIGYFLNAGNNVNMNTQKVALFTSAYGNGHGHGINPDNFTRSTSLFAARGLVKCVYYNYTDEYIKPNTNHPQYREFELDAVIWSLFSPKSNQSSLRNIEYKGKTWNIKNEFFWMPVESMQIFADEYGLDDTYQDTVGDTDRFVYKYLHEHREELSPEAKAVLVKAVELVEKSMIYRSLFNETHEEYQILNWDCGYYQLKALWKEYLPKEYKEFTDLVKKLGEKMLPMVYELGFLRK